MRDGREPRLKPRLAAIAKREHLDPIDVMRQGLNHWCERKEAELGIAASDDATLVTTTQSSTGDAGK